MAHPSADMIAAMEKKISSFGINWKIPSSIEKGEFAKEH
jgi:hypothetical protein